MTFKVHNKHGENMLMVQLTKYKYNIKLLVVQL